MYLIPQNNTTISDMHALFGYQAQPPISVPDYAWNYTSQNTDQMQDVTVLREANCLILAPRFVPHHQSNSLSTPSCLDAGLYTQNITLPTFNWSSLSLKGGTGTIQSFADRTGFGFEYQQVTCSADTIAASSAMDFVATASCTPTDASRASQGFYILLQKSVFQATSATMGSIKLQFSIGVQDPANSAGTAPGCYIRLFIYTNSQIAIEKSIDSVSWTRINSDIKIPGDAVSIGGGGVNERVTITLMYINYKLIIRIAGDSNPFVFDYPVPGDQLPQIGNLTIEAVNFSQFAFSAHKMKFATTGKLVSNQIDLNITPDQTTPVRWSFNDGISSHVMTSGTTFGYGDAYGSQVQISTDTSMGGVGRIKGIKVTANGSGYTKVPQVVISGGGGSNATALAVLDNQQKPTHGVQFVQVSNNGSGYTSQPTISFKGGGGNGASAIAYIESNQIVQYDLTLSIAQSGVYPTGSSSTYGDGTPVVTRVSAIVDPIFEQPTKAATTIYPKSIHEMISWNFVDLTIDHSLDLVVDNFHGITTTSSSTGITGSGNIGVQLALGYAHTNTMWQRFTGYCYAYTFDRPSPNVSNIILHCTDQMQQLRDVIFARPPDMDGWNHWYAMRFLLNYAGIPDSQIGWGPNIPTGPFDLAAGDSYIYFLPFGTGMNPWSPRDTGMSVYDLAMLVKGMNRFQLYQDAFGIFQYSPYIPSATPPAKKIFSESPDPVNPGNLTEYFNFSGKSDTSPVSNQFVTIGIDAWSGRWDPIVSSRTDQPSISSPPGNQPRNYVGFRKVHTESSPFFSRKDIGDDACERQFEAGRLPDWTCTFETWMQPDIYPMDLIYVQDLKSGFANTPMYVIQTDTHWNILDGSNAARTTITCRYLGG